MSRLDVLIKEHCPNGVIYTSLDKVCDISKGVQFNKSDMQEEGTYPVINGGMNPSGYIEQYNQERNTITISQGGASAGFVNWVDTEFWAGAHCYVLKPFSTVLNRYLFHFVKSKEKQLQECQYGAGIPALGKATVSGLSIPIPPIEVQLEIVQILDTFTNLNAELNAELVARQKQYEYYRRLMFKLNEDAKTVSLDEISDNYDYQRRPVTKSDRTAGVYPYYGASGIVDYVDDYIFDGDYLLVSEDGANLLARVTPIAFPISGKNWVNNHAHILKFQDWYDQRYVEIYLNGIDLSKFVSGAAQPKLNQKNLNLIPIPYPSKEKRVKIVDALDRFDKLCNDTSDGLPAEIEARTKQYEYYREKLLTFKKKQ